jgi:hypothetical protein
MLVHTIVLHVHDVVAIALGILNSGFNIIGIDPYVQNVAKGADHSTSAASGPDGARPMDGETTS